MASLINYSIASVQVVVERVPKSQIPDIDKRKFLVPNDITIAQFMWIIRKRIQLAPEKAIFLFVNKTIPQSRFARTPLLVERKSHRCLVLVQPWDRSMLNTRTKTASCTSLTEEKTPSVKLPAPSMHRPRRLLNQEISLLYILLLLHL